LLKKKLWDIVILSPEVDNKKDITSVQFTYWHHKYWGFQMKQMMMKRARTRPTPTTRSKLPGSMKSNSTEFSHSDNLRGNIRSNIQNSVEKYTTLAREAMMTGDRVLAESFYQQAEHYLRLNNEYKENIVVLPRNEAPVAESAESVMIPANDFELSIEQELAIAQANS
jgi:hypothetical protein